MTLAMTLADWLQCGDAKKLLCVLDTAAYTVYWPGDALCLAPGKLAAPTLRAIHESGELPQ